MTMVWMTSVATTLLVALLLHFTPRWTRPDIFFGVTVPPELARSDEARRILGRYRLVLWASALAGLSVAVIGRRQPYALVAQLLLLVGFVAGYVAARRQVLPHAVAPSTVREATLSPRRRGLPGGWMAQLGPFALLSVALLRGRHESRPELLVAVLTCLLLTAIVLGWHRGTRLVAATGPAAAAENEFRRLAAIVMVATQYLVALTAAVTAVVGRHAIVPWLSVGGAVCVLVLALSLARLGQGGSRRVAPPAEAGAPVGDRTRDEFWRGGLVYFNRDDPALFVEKRFGVGYTLNFGNALAWVLLAVVAGVIVASILLVPRR